ncbi:hypothetical protein QFZ77_006273 [Paenibacillus sp. V4I3]|uniref:hypothetical protein n=1 Tax=unclassified Paenibacillus TaxID=185978 RepID=UPI00277E86AE|nr:MULTISPECIES: hypothetical protein [unclassified Paenibacillus]MDQ0877614.1 hypothetical protein [Paenibacillus sp. V4I3]MDQ0886513.1 hypothetical protein [Paenibacillus sp. V4I9]
MKEVLVVRHSVGGRTFIHTEQQPMEYSVMRMGQGWRITLIITQDVDIHEILRWKQELNVFLFREYGDQPAMKIWFYVKEGLVIYDEPLKQLTIFAESRIEYIPDEFGI